MTQFVSEIKVIITVTIIRKQFLILETKTATHLLVYISTTRMGERLSKMRYVTMRTTFKMTGVSILGLSTVPKTVDGN